MLQRGDAVSHFDVVTVGGRPFKYSAIWQRKNLVLIALEPEASEASERYISQVTPRMPVIGSDDTECVITREAVPGLPAPAVLVADRWGEIVYSAAASDVANLPSSDELFDWLRFVQTTCPECEGEAK